MKEIVSVSNEKIQYVRKLVREKSFRLENNEFVVEGANIIKDLPKNIGIKFLFVEESKIQTYKDILAKFNEDIIFSVSSKVMNAISDTSTPPGILCVIDIPNFDFDDKNIVVLDGVSDPGNFGTIIRTCVACGVKNIIAINCVDYTSPKVVRSSMGGVFKVVVKNVNYEKALQLLEGYNVLSLDMSGKSIYDMEKTDSKIALVVGSEAHGVSKIMLDRCDNLISLPMIGDIESLNAAISLSVALYHLTFAL